MFEKVLDGGYRGIWDQGALRCDARVIATARVAGWYYQRLAAEAAEAREQC
jgi:hypothetical protein